MKVEIVSHTPDAWNLLLGTKSTRMRGKDPKEMTDEERYENWQYMLNTIQSPFEFVDYVFDISDVSKNFTHQLVRTRTGAYQQETSRALEVNAFDTVRPRAFDPASSLRLMVDGEDNPLFEVWSDAIAEADAFYKALIAAGAELQDARAILPSNMPTRIKAKFNLRTLSDMAKVRLCTRTQGEYQEVFREMRRLVLALHPWAEPLLQPSCVGAGRCAFPRHGKSHCKFWRPWMDVTAQQAELRKEFWESEVTTNNPVAFDGKSSS